MKRLIGIVNSNNSRAKSPAKEGLREQFFCSLWFSSRYSEQEMMCISNKKVQEIVRACGVSNIIPADACMGNDV